MIVNDSDYLNKDEIREALPMEFVLGWYGRALTADGKALCPFHDDHDPSLKLWVGDDEITRWSCWACSPQKFGDVFDFIMEMEGGTFGDALAKAREILENLPADYQPTFTAPPATPPPDLGVIVTEAQRRAVGDGWLSIATKLVSTPQTDADLEAAKKFDRYLIDNWGWGVGPDGSVVMPHWDADGNLTGAKIRSSTGDRWSVPGSLYHASLYGAWRGRQGKAGLVTEGETDNVWAAYHAQHMKLTVMGLPSGAGAKPIANWEANLRGLRTIYLCFDADDAGTAAIEAWLDYLGGMGYRDVRVCRLPLRLDLRDTRPDMAAFLEAAIRPDRHYRERLNLHILGDPPQGYGRVRRGQDSPTPITQWHVQPRATLVPGDPDVPLPPAVEGLVAARGREEMDIISADDLESLRKLKAWTEPRLLGFEGADADVSALRSYLLDRASYLPEVFQTGRVGLHNPPPRYRYLGRTLAYPGGYVGTLPWQIVQAERIASLDGQTTFSPEPRDLNWLYHFLTMNESKIMQPLLAWLIAATRRTEVRDFPLIFLGGSSGAGKSTIARIGCDLVGSRAGVHLGQSTPFVLLAYLSSTTTLPIFVDEWTLKSREDARETLQGSIPAIFEGSTAYRGTAQQTLIPYRLTSPTIVAGEDAFQMERELERTIVLNLNRAEQNYQALQALEGEPLGAFGYHFYDWLVAQSVDQLPQFPEHAPTRPAYNKAVLETGWNTLLQYLDSAAHYEAVPQLPATPDMTAVDESQADRTDTYLEALRLGFGQTDSTRDPLVWPSEQGTYVRFSELIRALQRNADIELPGGASAMKRHFETLGYVLSDSRVETETGMRRVRATLVHGLYLDNEEAT